MFWIWLGSFANLIIIYMMFKELDKVAKKVQKFEDYLTTKIDPNELFKN